MYVHTNLRFTYVKLRREVLTLPYHIFMCDKITIKPISCRGFDCRSGIHLKRVRVRVSRNSVLGA